MFAVVSDRGNQLKVEEGREYKIDLIEEPEDKKVTFEQVLLVSDAETKVGSPYVEGASVEAEFIDVVKGEKIKVFKFHAKKRYQRTKGHTQKYSLIRIKKIKA